jgi:hypothetical protein
MSWCTDAGEDEAISLFAGLLANPDVPLSLVGKVGVFKKLWRQEHQPCVIQRSNSRPGARSRLTIGHLHCNFVDLCLVHGVFSIQRLLDCLFPGEQPAFVGALRPPPLHLTTPILQEDLGAKPHQRIHDRPAIERISAYGCPRSAAATVSHPSMGPS